MSDKHLDPCTLTWRGPKKKEQKTGKEERASAQHEYETHEATVLALIHCAMLHQVMMHG